MDIISDLSPRLPREPVAPSGLTEGRALTRLLFGRADELELPSLTELTSAAITLAAGHRRRTLLPLAASPSELALERRGDDLFVSLYTTTAHADVLVKDRKVALGTVLETCARLASSSAAQSDAPILEALASRATRTTIAALPDDDALVVRGGVLETPRRGAALAFGYELSLRGATRGQGRGVRADVHALLADGTLTAHVHGRKLVVSRGPILLSLGRMLSAARSVAEAREAQRQPHVRLRHGGFAITLRADADGKVSVTLDAERGESVTAASLPLDEALLPIAKLGSELISELIAFDRTQARNLRVRALREDVRVIRRLAQRRAQRTGFLNADAERIRASLGTSARPSIAPAQPSHRPAPSNLRFGERWRIALDGLDADGTYLCGDRLVVSSSRHTVAIRRDDGAVLWARDGESASVALVGDVLVRRLPDGRVELCHLDDGEVYAEGRVAPLSSGPCRPIPLIGDGTPPSVLLREGPTRLAALDLRTGELRYRFGTRRGRPFEIATSGRLLCVASDEGVHGLDAASGEELFRHVEEEGAIHGVALVGDRIVASYEGDGTTLVVLDASTGRAIARRTLRGRPSAPLLADSSGVFLATRARDGASLHGFDLGLTPRFDVEDPSRGRRSGALTVDGALVLHVPNERLLCLDARDGVERWSTPVGRTGDDVPRRVTPMLRSGVLFVPAGRVELVRPGDGGRAIDVFPCDLVPDRLLVDERSWVYVAEESGHLSAHAPVAHLTLIRGGL